MEKVGEDLLDVLLECSGDVDLFILEVMVDECYVIEEVEVNMDCKKVIDEFNCWLGI